MTWPWIAHLRDAAPDAGDPYISSWVLWWDFHQTFRDPLHLFHGNIFFPHLYSLAFSEHDYGIALPLFPLFALGLRPLTAQGVATLLGFALCGYGAFRLARTLTGSTGAAWIAGIGFAFVPYRFHQLSHVVYVTAGWMPLLLEALVLYLRKPTTKRALWLGAAFTMNALCCIHWFVLTLPPLVATAVFLWVRYRRGTDVAAAGRGLAALGGAALILAPFLVPYQRAAQLYGFVRRPEEASFYSARLLDWLTPDPKVRLWHELGAVPAHDEHCLFPGLALLLLPLAALLLAEGARVFVPAAPERRAPGGLLRLLDAVALASGTVALLAYGEKPFVNVHLLGLTLLKADEPWRALTIASAALLVRWWFAYPRAFTFSTQPNLRLSLKNGRRNEAIGIGLIWAAMGFAGSFGMSSPFHRLLWNALVLFRSIRVPTRWAMVADLGLALLAGAGALALARAVANRFPRVPAAAPFGALAVAMLLDQRAAPLLLISGDVDPDPLTLRLKETPMSGGLVELPSGGTRGNYRHTLRAADHGKPLVNAISGFAPPLVQKLEDLACRRPIPDELMDLLERIPASYVSVHEAWLDKAERATLHAFLGRGLAAGRLRYVNRFGPPGRDDLYAVAKTEPAAREEAELPWLPLPEEKGPAPREDAGLLGSVDDPPEGAVISGPLLVRGWARIAGEDLGVTIAIDGEVRNAPVVHADRPDVSAALPQLGDTRSAGYEARYAFAPEDAGTHEILVMFRSADGRVRHVPIRRFVWRP